VRSSPGVRGLLARGDAEPGSILARGDAEPSSQCPRDREYEPSDEVAQGDLHTPPSAPFFFPSPIPIFWMSLMRVALLTTDAVFRNQEWICKHVSMSLFLVSSPNSLLDYGTTVIAHEMFVKMPYMTILVARCHRNAIAFAQQFNSCGGCGWWSMRSCQSTTRTMTISVGIGQSGHTEWSIHDVRSLCLARPSTCVLCCPVPLIDSIP
jgi:hypothetical protein